MAAGNRKEVGEEAAEVEEVACLINNLSIDSLLSFIRSVSFQSCFIAVVDVEGKSEVGVSDLKWNLISFPVAFLHLRTSGRG